MPTREDRSSNEPSVDAPDGGGFRPIAVAEVEIAAPIPSIAATADGLRYGSAKVVVRLHTQTVGAVDIEMSDAEGGISPPTVATAIWTALGARISDHLRGDGLEPVTALDTGGLSPVAEPVCLRQRAAVLADPATVTVLICTRDRADKLARTLRSVRELEYRPTEVLVVDGSPGPETRDLVRDEFPEVRYLGVGAHGKSFALNRGFEAAVGSVVACTDDDVRVDRHWLSELMTGFADPKVAVVTGVAFPMELRTQAQAWFEESGAFTEGLAQRTIGLDLPSAKGSLLPFATGKIGAGVSMAWRRAVLLELGGFDVALDTVTPTWPPGSKPGTAAEDLAAFFDALLIGHHIAFQPNAIVYHEHRRGYAALQRQIYWHGLGLSAYLVRCLLRQPRRIPGFLARVPRGLVYGFGASSVRNSKKGASYPAALTRAEWRGVLNGPAAYIRGLPAARRVHAEEQAEVRTGL